MKELLPLKIRSIAACCHLSAAIWLGIFYVIGANNWLSVRTFTHISNLAIVMLFLFGTIPLLVWLLLRNVDDFVDLSGRKVVAYHCSLIVYALCLLAIYFYAWLLFLFFLPANMSASVTTNSQPILKVIDFIWRSGDAIVTYYPAIVCIHTLNLGIATVKTLQGKVFLYPLTIAFRGKRSK
jgi:uncharacterized Tic20 family protein